MFNSKKIFLSIILLCIAVVSYSQYKKVNCNGLDIYYRVFGQGEPILILGGGPGDVSDRYLSLCELLSKNYKCILVEQRGNGKSTPVKLDSKSISLKLTLEDFELLRKSLSLKKWTVLGFSYGGLLATIYTNTYQQSVSKLILLNSAGLKPESFSYFLDNINSKLQASDKEIVEYWSDSARMSKNRQHAITEMIRAKMPGYFYDRKKSLIVSMAISDSDFNFELGKFIWDELFNQKFLKNAKSEYEKPVLILQGRQDPLGEGIPIELSFFYTNSKLRFIEKSGHYSWIEQPDKVLSEINLFMNESNLK